MMILLSEVADKFRNEIHTWPAEIRRSLKISLEPDLKDVRKGDERRLIEILGLLAGLTPDKHKTLNLTLSGDDRQLMITLKEFGGAPDAAALERKAPDWCPELKHGDEGLQLRLNLPACALHPPVDIEAMARETGLRSSDAFSVVEGFMASGRKLLKLIRETSGTDRAEDCSRAVHSMKGAGKNLRAPELAAASRALELCLNRGVDSNEHLPRLESAWQQIEKWFEEVR